MPVFLGIRPRLTGYRLSDDEYRGRKYDGNYLCIRADTATQVKSRTTCASSAEDAGCALLSFLLNAYVCDKHVDSRKL